MSDSENEITIMTAPLANGNLIDPNISKREDIEDEYSEIIEDLKERGEKIDKAVNELTELAIAAQNPDTYKALSLMIQASAKNTREMTLALKMKAEQIEKSIGSSANQSVVPQHVTTNNTLVMTTTEMMRQLRESGDE